jgi:hypothetical protein
VRAQRVQGQPERLQHGHQRTAQTPHPGQQATGHIRSPCGPA